MSVSDAGTTAGTRPEDGAPPDPDTPPNPAVPPDDDPRWSRTHPASPWLQNLLALGAVALFVPRALGRMLSDGDDPSALLHSGPVRWIVTAGAVLLVLALAAGVLAWRRRLFIVTDQAIHVRSGRFQRTVTTVPLDRVQSVDVVLPLVPRTFGLAKVQVEVAGDTGSAVELQLLRQADAHALRARLLREDVSAGATAHASPTDAVEKTGTTSGPASGAVAIIPPARARQAVRRSPAVWGSALALLGSATMLVAGIMLRESGAWGSGAFTLAGSAVALGKAVFGVLERSSGFRVERGGDTLRVHHGIAEKHHRTIAPRRVQAVTLSQPLLWRSPGWWSVTVTVPGLDSTGDNDAGDDTKAAASDLFPIATTDEALRLIALALPDVPASGTIAATMAGERLAELGFVAAPRRARIFAPLGWRHEGVLVTPEALVVRRGRWNRRITVLGHQHPQVLTIGQGWWSRRRDLADLTLALPRQTVTVSNLDARQAWALWATQTTRAS